jgi:hypothetical protein
MPRREVAPADAACTALDHRSDLDVQSRESRSTPLVRPGPLPSPAAPGLIGAVSMPSSSVGQALCRPLLRKGVELIPARRQARSRSVIDIWLPFGCYSGLLHTQMGE